MRRGNSTQHADLDLVSLQTSKSIIILPIMAQASKNKALNEVFNDLFDPIGAEIFLKPATDYIQAGVAVSFYTVVEAARQRGEVAIGYRVCARESDEAHDYGVVVNPAKSQPITFAPGDKVIVLAES